jgi:hypothetical protein
MAPFTAHDTQRAALHRRRSCVILVMQRKEETIPSQAHQEYCTDITTWFMEHGRDPGVAEELEMLAHAFVVLMSLDLEPARDILTPCYAKSSRGSKPWDPVVMLRSMLLGLLVGQTKINKWVPQTRASTLLPLLAGIDAAERRPPGVGTYYDFFHRLHDGPIRRCCEHQERPSVHERRRAETVRPREKKPDKSLDEDARSTVTKKLVEDLAKTETQGNPNDLQDRLGAILLAVGVIPSAERGLLGDLDQLVIGGDGSSLRTSGPTTSTSCRRAPAITTCPWRCASPRLTTPHGWTSRCRSVASRCARPPWRWRPGVR